MLQRTPSSHIKQGGNYCREEKQHKGLMGDFFFPPTQSAVVLLLGFITTLLLLKSDPHHNAPGGGSPPWWPAGLWGRSALWSTAPWRWSTPCLWETSGHKQKEDPDVLSLLFWKEFLPIAASSPSSSLRLRPRCVHTPPRWAAGWSAVTAAAPQAPHPGRRRWRRQRCC